MMTARELQDLLGLKPHAEGGFFAETYRSAESVAAGTLPRRFGGARAFSTAIYYMVTAESPCLFHRVKSDEVWHFYLGEPLELLMLQENGPARTLILGAGLESGARPQAVVPQGVWQAARVVPGGAFTLVGTTVAPGFDFADWEAAPRAALLKGYPQSRELVTKLTAPPRPA